MPPGYAPKPGPAPEMPCPPPPPPPGQLMPDGPLNVPLGPQGSIPFYCQFEYLHWFVQRPVMPPLLTVGSLNDFSFGSTVVPGALGAPSTQILLGQLPQTYVHNGFRFTTGCWFDPDQTLGLQASFFDLPRIDPRATAGGPGDNNTPLISRPFTNAVTNTQDADPVTIPNLISGHITFSNPQSMLGAELNLVHNYYYNALEGTRYGVLLGGRLLSLSEKLQVEQIREQLPDVTGFGETLEGINENFTCYNRFYGGQVGCQFECCLGPLQVQCVAKCAAGVTQQTVQITGGDTVVLFANPAAGLPQNLVIQGPYTLWVQPGNYGTHVRSVFSVAPEAQFNLAWVCNDTVTLTAGYNLIFWTNVVRPGQQVDLNINQQPLGDNVPVLPVAPQFLFHSHSIWIQGFQVGVHLNW